MTDKINPKDLFKRKIVETKWVVNGWEIARLRESKDCTQTTFANILSWDRSYLCLIERGGKDTMDDIRKQELEDGFKEIGIEFDWEALKSE